MQPLEKPLRNRLERTVKEARKVAETAAAAALDQLGVSEAAAFDHLSAPEKALRRRLRAHGRQLGDSLNGGQTQTLERLTEEVAYEHWHRMLFARFLAENDLLMYPDPEEPVAVSLEDCEELAADEGAANGWELAARFAARMLPRIFRPDSPVFELTLPPEHQQRLERLIAELPAEVFAASDSLGWVYQFWQASKKDEVNNSEVKIGARELPAVTQLFTEPYMVAFLLDNALGAWWAGRRLSEEDLKNAESEGELREKAAIPGVPLEYLRFVRGEDETWNPAAGTFDGWPERLAELKTLDPCCGSGHFLVAVFRMLVPMRMELEGLSVPEAVDRVLAENIHGLEIDPRCVELAAFALALAAWRFPGAEGYRPLPELNVACSGLAVNVAKAEWKQLGLGKKNLTIALDWMYETFKDAPLLGSLIDPAKTDAAKIVAWEELSGALEKALQKEQNEERLEFAVAAHGLAKAAVLLSRKYHWVVTNVPYLSRGKQSHRLRTFCQKYNPMSKNDLATVFLERCLEFCFEENANLSNWSKGNFGKCNGAGAVSLILPQNWLFLNTYAKLRKNLLKNNIWHLMARLGPSAFETISGEVVKAILIILSRGAIDGEIETIFEKRKDKSTQLTINGIDVSCCKKHKDKAEKLPKSEIITADQAIQLNNPDARISFEEIQGELLDNFGFAFIGQRTGDGPRFISFFWEFERVPNGWEFFGTTVKTTTPYSGNTQVIFWEDGDGRLAKYQVELAETQYASGGWKQGWQAWNERGVRISQMNILPATIHCKSHFDNNTATLVANKEHCLPAIWCFCSSPEYNEAVRQIDQSLKVTNATLVKVPFDLDHWTKIAQEKYPNGLPEPYTDDPTQWIFHGHPCGSVIWDEDEKWTAHGPLRTDPTVLQVAVARLLGYRWPAELDPEMELAEEQRKWVRETEALNAHADADGIVCIPPVRGEPAAADRLLKILAAAYGDAWTTDTLSTLLANAGHGGKTLETWLRDKFFAQHLATFQQRPFVWHIWDGLRDGFSVLLNYNKLDAKNLETLIYTYLGDWIARRKKDIGAGVDAAQEKLAAAENLHRKLEKIREGEAPLDIFVRWKPIEEQPIGWEPDLDDGVRLNIRPFMTAGDIRKKGAGVLREKPNIHWKKDRGKDVPSAPWFPQFQGDRINDHHLTLEEKRAARRAKELSK